MKKLLPLAAFVAVATFGLQAHAHSHLQKAPQSADGVQVAKVLKADIQVAPKVGKQAQKK